MRIVKADEQCILFDNGDKITFGHEQDCCEHNYADFTQLEQLAFTVNFSKKIVFEAVPQHGFRFGNYPWKMFFVPCYSCQNGYYSNDVSIYFNNEEVLNFKCEECFDF